MWPFSSKPKPMPKIIADNLIPLILDQRDVAVLKCMHNCKVGGTISLPSGRVIAAPPPGQMWLINDGAIVGLVPKE